MTGQETDKATSAGLGSPEPVSPYKAGFSCRCPKCGKGPIYKNGLELVEECSVCGFDLRSADAGDGAQVFVILILGAICAILGFLLYGMQVPMWLLLTILGVVIIGGTIWMLRVFKATLVALQFHHDASEGVLVKDEKNDS